MVYNEYSQNCQRRKVKVRSSYSFPGEIAMLMRLFSLESVRGKTFVSTAGPEPWNVSTCRESAKNRDMEQEKGLTRASMIISKYDVE